MADLATLCVTPPAIGAGSTLTADGLRLVVEIAVPITEAVAATWGTAEWGDALWSTGAARWGISTWGESQWSSGLEWFDLSERVRGTSWQCGKGALTDQPDVGVWLVDFANLDGYLSPRNSTSDFPAPTYLTPGTLMRIGYWDDVTWNVAFTGIIEDINEAAVQLDADVWATFTVVQTTTKLARIDRPEQSPIGAGEAFDARMDRLLEDAVWSYGADYSRVLSFTTAGLQATTMAENRMSEVKLTADSVFADVYTGRDGLLTMATKGTVQPLVSPDVTFYLLTDETGPKVVLGTTYEALPWAAAPAIKSNADGMVNTVSAARVGSTSITASDTDSAGRTFESAASRTDLILDDDFYVDLWVNAYLALAAGQTVKISDVTLDADQAPLVADLLQQLDQSGFLYVLRQWRRYPELPAVRYGARVIGYSVAITPNTPGTPSWTATLRLDVTGYSEV